MLGELKIIHLVEVKVIISIILKDYLLMGFLNFQQISILVDNCSFLDYAWVPKPLLSQYFDDDYFNSIIKLTVHIC
jgi:hypothetical protein